MGERKSTQEPQANCLNYLVPRRVSSLAVIAEAVQRSVCESVLCDLSLELPLSKNLHPSTRWNLDLWCEVGVERVPFISCEQLLYFTDRSAKDGEATWAVIVFGKWLKEER